MVTCPNCAHPNSGEVAQCSRCYSPLPAIVNCPSCGADIRAGAGFCGQCGAQLGDAVKPAFEVLDERADVGFAALDEDNVAQEMASSQPQPQRVHLQHIATNTIIELPANQALIHIGKPNDRVPPDIDISGFPHSEVVSRVHADILVEEEAYYVEDTGSSNGTYVNNLPVAVGSRHRLRPGDRVAFGKEDKVSFLFQTLDGKSRAVCKASASG